MNAQLSVGRQRVREFAKYASASVLGMVAVSVYILADTFFVSARLGETGLAALNLAIPAYNIIHGVGLLFGVGGSTRYAVCRSRGDERGAHEVFSHTLLPLAFFSVLFCVLGAFFAAPLATLLGADEQTHAMTEVYLRVLLLFSPAILFNDFFLCFLRNDGAPRLAMCAMIVGSFANILLDYVFLFPCGMGMFGAVFATGMSPLLGVGIALVYCFRGKSGFRLLPPRPSLHRLVDSFLLGFPAFVEQFSSAVVIFAFNALLYGLIGNTGVAAYGVTANLSLVVVAVFSGVGQGTQPLLSRAHGREDAAGERACFLLALGTSLFFSLALYAAVFFFAEPIADLFNREHDPALREIAAQGLRLYFLGAPFAAFNVIVCAAFSATERALPSHAVALARGLVFLLPAAFALAAAAGVAGVWLSYPLAEGLAALLGAAFLFLGARRRARAKEFSEGERADA